MGEYMRLWKAEWLKQKRSFTWPLVIATPVLGTLLTFINLFFRYDYLRSVEANRGLTSWQFLLLQHHFLWAFLLSLVATVLAAQVHYLEHKANGWKQVLALPVSRGKLYAAKWTVVLTLSTLMILGNNLCLFLAGQILGFPEAPDLPLFTAYTAYQVAAVAGLTGLQCWLSAAFSNASLALGAGFVGVASSLFLAQSEALAKFIPYTHPIYALPDPTVNNAIAFGYGPALGLVLLMAGTVFFQRRDIC
ncbi:MAG TPA: ABC transporter permease subunit [Clostridia bacterium]|nr:ABC transporter permease subunit [Clostridia bacterium]